MDPHPAVPDPKSPLNCPPIPIKKPQTPPHISPLQGRGCVSIGEMWGIEGGDMASGPTCHRDLLSPTVPEGGQGAVGELCHGGDAAFAPRITSGPYCKPPPGSASGMRRSRVPGSGRTGLSYPGKAGTAQRALGTRGWGLRDAGGHT